MKHTDAEPAGRLVRRYRLAAGLTQGKLADAAGVSIGVVRDLEQGRTSHLQEKSIAKLATALGLDGRRMEDFARVLRTGRSRPRPVARPVAAPATGPAGLPPHADGLWLRVLGPLQAWREWAWIDLGPPAQRAVLGLLALSPDEMVSREAIIDALWGDQPPATAVGLVQGHVSRLRRALDPGRSPRDPQGVLVSVATGYCLQVGADQLDLLGYRAKVGQARAARAGGDVGAACDLYEEALGLWRGDPLADVGALRSHPALMGLVRRLTAMIIEYAEAACGGGLHGRVLLRLEDLAAREPLDEKAHAQLMIALAGSGRQAAALGVYQDLRHRLDDQLGLLAGAELNDAYQRVLRQDLAAAP